MDINDTNILITGGCGLVGSTTVEQLLQDYSPESIVIFDNLSRGTIANVEKALNDPRVKLIQQDIRDKKAVQHANDQLLKEIQKMIK